MMTGSKTAVNNYCKYKTVSCCDLVCPYLLKNLKRHSIYLSQKYLSKKKNFGIFRSYIVCSLETLPYSIRLYLHFSLKRSDVSLSIVMIDNGNFLYVKSYFKCAYSLKQSFLKNHLLFLILL